MTEPIRSARKVAMYGVFLAVLLGSGVVLGQPCLTRPCSCGYACVPNEHGFGYYPARWRQWPGESRPDIYFPQSVGAEVLQRPEGEKMLPPPSTGRGPGEMPIEGSILPPVGGFPIEPLPEPSIVVPGESPVEMPAEPPVEAPSQLPDERPAEPPLGESADPAASTPAGQAVPSESRGQVLPNWRPPEAPVEAPPAPAEETAIVSPFLQDGWAALAVESREARPLFGPSWLGHLPRDRRGMDMSHRTVGLPEVGPSLRPQPAAEKIEAVLPDVGPELLRFAPRSVTNEKVDEAVLSISESPDRPSSSETSQHKALRANWTAALHPGFRNDLGRMPGGYPSTERSIAGTHSMSPPVNRPVMYNEPVNPQAPPAAGRPAGRRPDAQPPVRPQDAPQVRTLPTALDGYCPVELGEGERWAPGNPRWSATHQDRTYFFAGPAQRQRFLANPRRYVPAYAAHDPVLVVDGNRHIPGHTDHCVIYDGQLYMFSNSATLTRFKENPQRYVVVGRK